MKDIALKQQKLISVFNKLSRSLASYDLNLVRECYHLPCTLSTPDNVMLLNNEDDFNQAYQAIFQQLKDANLSSFKMLNSSFQLITEELLLVNVDWQFFSEDEQLITDFTAIYHMIFANEQYQIMNVVSQDMSQSLVLNQALTFK